MNGSTIWSAISPALVSAAVFAAMIAAITNVVIAIMNNKRLAKLERKKAENEIDKLRYTKLYELLQTWDKYTTKNDKDIDGLKISDWARTSAMHHFFDCQNRYKDVAKPLLDEKYVTELDAIFREGTDKWFEVLLNRKRREELVALMKEQKDKPKNFEQPEEVFQLLVEELQPMQDKEGGIILGIDLQYDSLLQDFCQSAVRSSRLRELIEQQLAELLRKNG